MNHSNNLVFSFTVDPSLSIGIQRLASLLPFTIGSNGIQVSAAKGNQNSVSLKNGHATICYTRKNLFFRELAILVEQAASKSEFSIVENDHFTGLSTMLDVSRNAVPTLPALYRLIDHLAIMGYDSLLMYMEDIVKLENYEYFGSLTVRA